MISAKEHYILSYYRAGELSGSLLMGRLAMHTTIDAIRIPLTRHCMEEAQHAWLWTQTIEKLGMRPLKVTDTFNRNTAAHSEFRKALLRYCVSHRFWRNAFYPILKNISNDPVPILLFRIV